VRDVLDGAAKMAEHSLASQGTYYYVFFQSWHNKSGKNWIEAICETIDVVADCDSHSTARPGLYEA
jgi:hypothetical protein